MTFDLGYAGSLDRKLEVLRASKHSAVISPNMMGSHEAYDQRYPPSFDFFHSESPRAGSSVKQTRVIDTYDNSVRFTDYDAVIGDPKCVRSNENAAVLYFSDHGERFFENDQPQLSGHGFPQQSSAELDVPLVLWLSPIYRQSHPEAVTQLEGQCTRASFTG